MEKENKVDKETRMSVSIGFGCIVYFIENMKPNQLIINQIVWLNFTKRQFYNDLINKLFLETGT